MFPLGALIIIEQKKNEFKDRIQTIMGAQL